MFILLFSKLLINFSYNEALILLATVLEQVPYIILTGTSKDRRSFFKVVFG